MLANRLKLSAAKPRRPSNLNRFSKYDGNILDGALLGCGMALTGVFPAPPYPK